MLDELFHAYAIKHLQTEPTENPKIVTVKKESVSGPIVGIFFTGEFEFVSLEDVVAERYFIRNPSIASPGEFVISILPYIRELNESEREVVIGKDRPLNNVFCFIRGGDFITVEEYSHYLSRDHQINDGGVILPHSFNLGTLCLTTLTQPTFFAVRDSVVLL
jgi:hypothetical protein